MGDLYLDIAEAYMEQGCYRQAEPLLKMLVKSQNYHLVSYILHYTFDISSLLFTLTNISIFQISGFFFCL